MGALKRTLTAAKKKVELKALKKRAQEFGFEFEKRHQFNVARIARANLVAGADGALQSSAAQGVISSLGTQLASNVGDVTQRFEFGKAVGDRVDFLREHAESKGRGGRQLGTAMNVGSAVVNFI